MKSFFVSFYLSLFFWLTSLGVYAESMKSAPAFVPPEGSVQVVPGSYIVKFRNSETMESVRGKISAKMSLKGAFSDSQLFQLSLKKGEDEKAAVEEMSQDPDVEYLEPDYILQKSIVYSPYSAPTEWGSVYQTRTTAMQAALSSTTRRPIVAVIDTGLDASHPLVTGSQALWINQGEIAGNHVDDDGNGYVDDVNGWNFVTGNGDFADDDDHGTHVAGIIIGAGIDIFASSLQTAKVRVMPLKFLGPSGGSTSNAIRAINYATQMGAVVMNNSWGGGSYSKALHEALTTAYSHSIFIVTAAGNSSTNNDTKPMYPANYDIPSNVSVAALSDSDHLASFSNYGSTTVSIGAPGLDIYSSIPSTYNGQPISTPYMYKSGTSMAAPYIAGLAALGLREAPQLSGYQIKNLLLGSGIYNSNLSGAVKNGLRVDPAGFIDDVKAHVSDQFYQVQYIPEYQEEATLASTSGTTTKKSMGCGSVASLTGTSLFDFFGGPTGGFLFIMIFSLPLVVWWGLRRQVATQTYHRKHPRFKVDSALEVEVGGRKLKAQMKTVALGGMAFQAQEILEKGGTVRMSIMSPDGKEMIEVEGQVVWAEDQQNYGVQFKEVQEGLLANLKNWSLVSEKNKA